MREEADVRALQLLAVAALTGFACRPDPGTPDYSGTPQEVNPDLGMVMNPQGSDPFVPGEARLSVGLFYEGGFSEQVLINNVDTNYFIFIVEGTGALTYNQETVEDRVEGESADRFELTGEAFWGGGIIYNRPRDFSRWRTIHFALKSADASLQQIDLTLQYGGAGTDAVGVTVPLTNYGWVNDGEWHDISVPLSDFAGLNRAEIRSPFILVGQTSIRGDALLVDDLYYLAE